MKKLLLIDGNSIMNRGFYALPVDLTNQEGPAYQCLLGFLNIFFRIYEEEHPTNICVAFDVHARPSVMSSLRIIRGNPEPHAG